MDLKPFSSIYGVDFSGAKLAGRTTWIARAEPCGRGGRRLCRLRLIELDRLEFLAGSAERGPALAHLVERIAASRDALWAIDFPFGIPVELLEEGQTWPRLLRFFREWPHDGYAMGVWWLNRAKALGGRNHVMRHTDTAARAPFSCYHYRIAYQTFHGIRDVLGPLTRHPASRGTVVLPFQAGKLAGGRRGPADGRGVRRGREPGRGREPSVERVLVEACPSSTLKRLGLPYQNYKQPEGGPLTWRRRTTRHRILRGLSQIVQIPQIHLRKIMRDGGGDALDSVIAAAGVSMVWEGAGSKPIRSPARVGREGYIFG